MFPSKLSGLNLLILCFHSTHCPALLHLLQKKNLKSGFAKSPSQKIRFYFILKAIQIMSACFIKITKVTGDLF